MARQEPERGSHAWGGSMFRPSTSFGEAIEPELVSPPNELHASVHSRTKRCIDIIVALVFLVAFWWLYLAVALLVAVTTGLPVIYRHNRIGLGGGSFPVLKFRSMVPDGDEVLRRYFVDHPEAEATWLRDYKLPNDPRVTPFGRLIRRTSLDELPQLWNVLRGDMTLVGPRPVTAPELIQYYGAGRLRYMTVKPGITGLWQVSGRSTLTYSERVAQDMHYLRDWSIGLDLKILLKTLWVVTTARGSY